MPTSIHLARTVNGRSVLLFGVLVSAAIGLSGLRPNGVVAVERRDDRTTASHCATARTVASARTAPPAVTRRIRFGNVPRGEYPLAPPITVNPFDDEGNAYRARTGARGPIPLSGFNSAAVAAVGCSFAAECDDGNPCTDDRCDIAPGGAAGTGTCKHDPTANGQPGDCDDGVFCNGFETCQGANVFLCLGTCAGGPNNGQPCTTDAATGDGCPNGVCTGKVCAGGPHDATACTYHSECTDALGACITPGDPCPGVTLCNENYDQPNDAFPPEFGGSCQPPCASDADCADPTATATTDGCTLDYCCVAGFYTQQTCSGTGAGNNAGQLCDGNIPCPGAGCPCRGMSAFCGNPVSVPCDADGVCVRGNPCGDGAECIPRFCVGGGPTFNGQPCFTSADCGTGGGAGVCTSGSGCRTGRCCSTGACERKFYAACAGPIGSRKWFPGDSGRVDGGSANCPTGVTCPKYGAGIGELGIFTVIAGPTSLSPVVNLMSGAPLRKLGDDYYFGPTPALITLTDLRFVGGVGDINNSRISFEFYDENGTFIEDIFFQPTTDAIAVQNVQFDAGGWPFDIPSKGFIAAHVLQAYALDTQSPGEFYWLATDEVDHGTNDPARLFVASDLSGNPVPFSNFLKACVGGVRKGAPCGSDGNCPASTCDSVPGILAFELEGPEDTTPPVGACCDGSGVCTQDLEWVCAGAGHQFLGVGQGCARCSADSPLGTVVCTVDTDCSFCVGGVDDGLPCPANPCTGGACLGTCIPVCSSGACCANDGLCSIAPDPGSCGGAWQGYGSDCSPDCCEQPLSSYTGVDNCEEVIFHILSLPSPGQETSITITGDNSTASSERHCQGGGSEGALCSVDSQCPGGLCVNDDSCYPPTSAGSELGWFEAFDLAGCAYVRVDFCCTDTNSGTSEVNEPKFPTSRVLYDACPCGQPIRSMPNPNNDPEEPADGSGAPYCGDDNAWVKFGPLPAGHYYYPIYSALGGDFGTYQLHFTAQACPLAACCHNVCAAASGPACVVSADCTEPNGEICINGLCQELCERDSDCATGTCESTCELLNILQCAAIRGAFLAPPNRGTAISFCAGACDTGSCCLGAGVCEDEFPPGDPTLTIDDCDALGGAYVGGFKCYGGTCGSGSRFGLSCRDDGQCPGCTPGNCCIGEQLSLLQPTPCPVCDIADADNCQMFDDSTNASASDLTVPGGARAADDFVPASDTINTVCVWGVYQKGSDFGGRIDCGGEVTDNFQVFVYNAAPVTGLPGTLKGVSSATGANVDKGVVVPTTFEQLFQTQVWAFKLNLDTPITGLTPGATYWLEVNNTTNDPIVQSPNCVWFWMGVDHVYNDYSASGSEWGYGATSAGTGDLSWCLDGAVTSPPAPQRACCTCEGTCSNTTKRDCDDAGDTWHVDQMCPSFTCPVGVPANDNCADVLAGPPIGEGIYTFDNHCASVDGPNPVPTELGAVNMAGDIWFKFRSDCGAGADLAVGTCATAGPPGGGIDTVVAVYHDPLNRTVCPCPTALTQAGLLWPNGTGSDEGCLGFSGGGVIQGDPEDPSDDITSGDCFLIRIGGYSGQGSEQGAGTLVIDCYPSDPFPDPLQKGADDICSNSANPCAVNSDCPGGFCRNKNRFITAVVPASASSHGIKISITNLDANSVATPANYNGTVRWAGAPAIGVNDGISPPFNASQLECTFVSSNWSAVGQVHFYGQTVVPASTYSVSNCNPEASCSSGLTLATAKFGDVVAPVNTVNFQDINSIVAKFQGTPAGPSKTRTKLTNSLVNPANPINFQEVSACVSAFQGQPFKAVVTTPPATCP